MVGTVVRKTFKNNICVHDVHTLHIYLICSCFGVFEAPDNHHGCRNLPANISKYHIAKFLTCQNVRRKTPRCGQHAGTTIQRDRFLTGARTGIIMSGVPGDRDVFTARGSSTTTQSE